jgi:Rhs element Vgr protein
MPGPVTATILNGSELDAKYEVLAIDVVKVVNRIPYAQIVLIDGSASEKTFQLSESPFFEPGQTVEIKLHYEGDSQAETVFKGVVTQNKIQATVHESLLTVELKDAAIALTRQRKNQVFGEGKGKIKDSAIIEDILKAAKGSGIKAEKVAPTKAEHGEMVQFYCTDWDFILARAEANGCWVLLEDGQIRVIPPDLGPSPKHSFQYGISEIYELEMDADIQHQYEVVQGSAWDDTQQKLSPSPKKAKDFALAQGNLSAKQLAPIVGGKQCDLVTSSTLEESEIQAWADAQMLKSRLSMIRGRLEVPGFADIHLGDVMELEGIGARFKGKTLVTGIRHQVTAQGWITAIQFGLAADWFTQSRPDIADAPASGLLPPVHGLQIGVVDKFVEDPDKKMRVRVKVPMLSNQAEGVVWARLATVDAGQQRGAFFGPELGDEVILGFLNDDPRQAIILGSMFSSKNKPPWEITKDNNLKGIVTKKKLTLHFNDEDDKESIVIETPGGNTIILTDEQDKGIEITDMNENSFTMNSKGVEIKSCKDFIVNASSGNITFEGKNITLKGNKVDVK